MDVDALRELGLVDALERLEERRPGEFPADSQALFPHIQAALRVPAEGILFRLLGKDPPLLASFWSALSGPLQTRYFEQEADRLRAHALPIAPHPDLRAQHRAHLPKAGLSPEDIGAIGCVHATQHYLLAKLLLLAAAGAVVLRGERIDGRPHADERDRELLAPGVLAEAMPHNPVPVERAEREHGALLKAIREAHDHPFAASWFLALLAWPAYLERAHTELTSLLGTPRYRSAAATLATLAEVSVKNLPDRVSFAVTGALPREVVHSLLRFFHERLFPELLLDVSYLRALLEPTGDARASPLSLTIPRPATSY